MYTVILLAIILASSCMAGFGTAYMIFELFKYF